MSKVRLLVGDLILGNVEYVRCRGFVRIPAGPEGLHERRIPGRCGEDSYLGLGVISPHERAAFWGADASSDL